MLMSGGSVQLDNHSGYQACYADDQIAGGTDPAYEFRYAHGWTCKASGASYEIKYDDGARVVVMLLVPGQGVVNYVDRHPGGRAVTQMPIPPPFDFGPQWYLRYWQGWNGDWHYDYSLDAGDPRASQAVVNGPLPFQGATAWDFTGKDKITVTINPP